MLNIRINVQITTAVSQFSKPIISKGNQCYLVSNRSFQLKLNFVMKIFKFSFIRKRFCPITISEGLI